MGLSSYPVPKSPSIHSRRSSAPYHFRVRGCIALCRTMQMSCTRQHGGSNVSHVLHLSTYAPNKQMHVSTSVCPSSTSCMVENLRAKLLGVVAATKKRVSYMSLSLCSQFGCVCLCSTLFRGRGFLTKPEAAGEPVQLTRKLHAHGKPQEIKSFAPKLRAKRFV